MRLIGAKVNDFINDDKHWKLDIITYYLPEKIQMKLKILTNLINDIEDKIS